MMHTPTRPRARLALFVSLFVAHATSQSASYAPTFVPCPSDSSLLRLAGTPQQGNQTLSTQEAAFVQGRRSAVAPNWSSWLSDSTRDTGYDLSQLAPNDSSWPILAIANSGQFASAWVL